MIPVGRDITCRSITAARTASILYHNPLLSLQQLGGVVVWENGEVVCEGHENVVAMSSNYVSR
jgi:hypothetical protein